MLYFFWGVYYSRLCCGTTYIASSSAVHPVSAPSTMFSRQAIHNVHQHRQVLSVVCCYTISSIIVIEFLFLCLFVVDCWSHLLCPTSMIRIYCNWYSSTASSLLVRVHVICARCDAYSRNLARGREMWKVQLLLLALQFVGATAQAPHASTQSHLGAWGLPCGLSVVHHNTRTYYYAGQHLSCCCCACHCMQVVLYVWMLYSRDTSAAYS